MRKEGQGPNWVRVRIAISNAREAVRRGLRHLDMAEHREVSAEIRASLLAVANVLDKASSAAQSAVNPPAKEKENGQLES